MSEPDRCGASEQRAHREPDNFNSTGMPRVFLEAW